MRGLCSGNDDHRLAAFVEEGRAVGRLGLAPGFPGGGANAGDRVARDLGFDVGGKGSLELGFGGFDLFGEIGVGAGGVVAGALEPVVEGGESDVAGAGGVAAGVAFAEGLQDFVFGLFFNGHF